MLRSGTRPKNDCIILVLALNAIIHTLLVIGVNRVVLVISRNASQTGSLVIKSSIILFKLVSFMPKIVTRYWNGYLLNSLRILKKLDKEVMVQYFAPEG